MDLGEVFDVLWLEAPADVDAAADDACVGAGDVEEDGIEGFVEAFGGGFAPVVHGGLICLYVEAGEVLFEAWDALFIRVGAGETFAGAEGGGDEESFSAGSSAGIEDFLAGLWVEEVDAVAGGGVLDVEGALCEEFVRDFAVEAVIFLRVGESLTRDFLGCFGERVESEKSFGGLVVPLHDGDGGFFAEGFAPALVEPIRMGVEGGGVHFLEVFQETLACSDGLAEDGVDE